MKSCFGFILVFLIAGAVFAKSEKRDVYVFITGLDKRALGFTLAEDERSDAGKIIVDRIGRLAKGSPHWAECTMASVETVKAKHAVAAVFMIKQFFLTYHTMGYHQGTINTMIAVFDTVNGYSRPYFTVSANDTGTWNWGNFRPFISSLVAVVDSLGEIYKQARDHGMSISSGSLQDCILSPAMNDCQNTVYLKKPEFSSRTMGYTPLDEEIHDFSDAVAYYLEFITGKRVIIVDNKIDDSVSSCAKEFAQFECFRTDNTFSLSLVPATAGGGVSFNQSISLEKGADWNDSVLFCRFLHGAFVKFYKTYKAKK
jgi:hypothetical protein